MLGRGTLLKVEGTSFAIGASSALKNEPVGRIIVDDVERLGLGANVDRSCPHSAINSVQFLGGIRVLSEPMASLLIAFARLASQEPIYVKLKLRRLASKDLLVEALCTLWLERSVGVDHGAVFVIGRGNLVYFSRKSRGCFDCHLCRLLLWCEHLG